MQKFKSVDQGRPFDWSKASRDYGAYRPGPPESFYQRLTALGVGLKDQKILDLGTGTGLVAPAEKVPFPNHSFDIVTCHFSYLPREDKAARETENLILKYNPEWTAADMAHEIPAHPEWAKKVLNVRAMFYYDKAIPFTRPCWSARPPSTFSVPHRIDAHILEFRRL